MKKRRHKYVISDTNYNGEPNENKADFWDACCLADYFYMDKILEEYANGTNDEYVRGNTHLEILVSRKRISFINKLTGRRNWKFIPVETMVLSKYNRKGTILYPLLETRSMTEISEMMMMFNEYHTLDWFTDYDTFMKSYI